MSKTKLIAGCLMILTLVSANIYTLRCYQEEKKVNEVLVQENRELRGHVEQLAAKSMDLVHKLEAANDHLEAVLLK